MQQNSKDMLYLLMSMSTFKMRLNYAYKSKHSRYLSQISSACIIHIDYMLLLTRINTLTTHTMHEDEHESLSAHKSYNRNQNAC